MALFGAPIAHGNDPERAVRAAVDIQAAMPALSAELGQDLKVHLGVALGEVVASGLGSAVHTAYTVTGEAANLAARLMERAASGETLVADALRKATEDIAVFEVLGLEQLKGLAQPETIHRLLGLKSSQAAEPVMVGRRAELRQLLALLGDCSDSGRGGAALIRGDPGIGKSRLLRQLKTEAASRGFKCVSGLVLDFGAHKGEEAFASVTARLLGSFVEATEESKVRAVHDALSLGRVDARELPFLHDLLGLPQLPTNQAIYAAMDTQARRRGMGAVLAKLLGEAHHQQPYLISVEDVHWANEATLDLLAALAVAAGQYAAVVVMTTRFDGDPFDAGRAQSAGALSLTIDLKPLQPEDAMDLASNVMAEIDEFVRQCIDRAEGNPLFLEQLLRSRLVDSKGKLPHSLQGVILARLDSLAEADRRALQAASVLGQRFVQDDLRSLLGSADYSCQPMIHRRLLRPDGDGYLFAHSLIRDGVYASLTRDRRRELHLKAATRFTDREPVLQAKHLDRAEDAAAVRAYLHAAEVEAAAYRPDRAIALATRGLELASRDDDRVKLGLAAGRLLLDVGLAKSARDAFGIAVNSAHDEQDRCRGLIGLAAAGRMLSDLDLALEHLCTAESIATAIDSPALLSEIHYMRGNLHFARGQGEACLSQHHLALEMADRADVPEWKARALSGLGDVAYLQGRVGAAQRYFQACVNLAESNNLFRIIPANQCMTGDCMALFLDFDGALDQISVARSAAVRIGDRFGEMFAKESEVYVLLSAGRLDKAEGPAEMALELAVKFGARRYEAYLRMALGQVRLAQNRFDDARKLLHAAISLAEETGLGFCGPWICGVLAQMWGSSAEGRAWINRGEKMLADANVVHNHVFFRKAAMEWAINAGDWSMVDRFAQVLTDYTAAEPLPYVDLIVRRARALTALEGNPEDIQATEAIRWVEETARAVDLRLPPRWYA
jgi:tetratricopeptide (TPR) repeat protein